MHGILRGGSALSARSLTPWPRIRWGSLASAPFTSQSTGATGAAGDGRHKFIVWVLGGPGSGKGTQCGLMKQSMDAEHIVPGDLLRHEVSTGSEMGRTIEHLMLDGRVVPARVTVPMLHRRIIRSGHHIVLVDGFPRDMNNRDAFAREAQRDCDMVLFFDCPEDELVRRLLRRAESSGRSDDNAKTIEKRLVTFHSSTRPVLEFYARRDRLYHVDASGDVGDIHKMAKAALFTEMERGERRPPPA